MLISAVVRDPANVQMETYTFQAEKNNIGITSSVRG
jgi:hypothetical protein